MEEKDPLTESVLGAAIEVHKAMGPGLLESVYQSCMEYELHSRGITCEPLYRMRLAYKELQLEDVFVMDLYFPGRLVVELKAVEKVLPVHEAQLMSYMRLAKVRVGLLINFHVPLLMQGVTRRVL